jgi:hypothetical protein
MSEISQNKLTFTNNMNSDHFIHSKNTINNNISKNPNQYIPKIVSEIAENAEAQLFKTMFDQMNQSARGEKSLSTSEDFFQSLLNDEQAKLYSQQNNGKGLQKVILDQIYPDHLRNDGYYKAFHQQMKIPLPAKKITIEKYQQHIAPEISQHRGSYESKN